MTPDQRKLIADEGPWRIRHTKTGDVMSSRHIVSHMVATPLDYAIVAALNELRRAYRREKGHCKAGGCEVAWQTAMCRCRCARCIAENVESRREIKNGQHG